MSRPNLTNPTYGPWGPGFIAGPGDGGPTVLVAETTHFRVARTSRSFSVRWSQSGAMPSYMAVSAKALAELSVACWLAGVPMPEWRTW